MADARTSQLFVASLAEAGPDVKTSQLSVTSLAEAGPDVKTSQFGALAVVNYPSEAVEISQLQVTAVTEALPTIRNSQLFVIAVVRGRVENPQVRAWTFSLDGHDFYVLRLGDDQTFVYDMYSDQWIDWTSPDLNRWRAITGINWLGGTLNNDYYGSNIVVGDDTFGLLWFLNPTQPYDDSPSAISEEQQLYFERIAMGQLTAKGRDVIPCYSINLTADQGEPAYSDAGVTLYTSDNGGQTFDDHGLITITPDEYTIPQPSWYSLGQIRAPGRLFKIVDDGAIARIDSLDMNDGG